MKDIAWLVPPNDLPIRLVLFRIIEAADGPIHMLEIEAMLAHYEVKTDHAALLTRLGELVNGFPPEFQIKSVMRGVWCKVPV